MNILVYYVKCKYFLKTGKISHKKSDTGNVASSLI